MTNIGISFKNSLIRGFVFFGFLFFSLPVSGQKGYQVFGKASVSEGSVSGLDARLKSTSETVILTVNEKGEFQCMLNWQQDYHFIFSKKGFISKSIRFSTIIPENISKNSIEPYMLLVELSPVMADVDTAFFENPVGFIRFDPSISDFDFDRDYSLKVKYSTPVQKKRQDNSQKTSQIQLSTKTPPKQSAMETKSNGETISESEIGEPALPVEKLKPAPRTLYAPDFPPLLENYPPGITREEFSVPGRQVTRVVLYDNHYIKVLLKVKHDWGGVFYFISEAPDYYRGISPETFTKLAGNK